MYFSFEFGLVIAPPSSLILSFKDRGVVVLNEKNLSMTKVIWSFC